MRLLLAQDGFAGDPALDVALAHALVERVSAGELGGVLRLYRPGPTLAFGRLDALRPGFPAAAAVARAHGFAPVVRAPGGHAVAYHGGCLGVDEVIPDPHPITGMQERFARSSDVLASALRAVGVDARIGRVAREFCPGDFTVSSRGAVKVVGTAQRVVRRASLLAASVAVRDGGALRSVLTDVYAALGLDMDPATAGAAEDDVPGLTVDAVEAAVLAAYAARHELVPAALDDATRAAASALRERHVVA